MKNRDLLLLLVFSLFIRFWKLGSVPDGVSISEAKTGIFLTDLFHSSITNIFFLRLPFAVLGVLSIFLFYILVRKLTKSHSFSILASFLVSISPLHIHESRIFSFGILIMVVFLSGIILFWQDFEKNYRKIILGFFSVSLILFVFSILKFPESVGQNVNWERNIAAKQMPVILTKLFSNKIIESYEYKKSLFFEHLDFGNYFFSGFPRPRWGVEELPKLYIVFLPFVLIGFFTLSKNPALQLILVAMSYCLFLSGFALTGPTWDLPLLGIFIYLTASGLSKLFSNRRYQILIYLSFFLLLFELISFFKLYLSGLTESQFSPRNNVYKKLIPQVREFSANGKQVFVSNRLGNPQTYFRFYDPELSEKTTFGEFDLKKDSRPERLFVGVLPFDPSPAEMLYKQYGVWPEYLEIYYVFPDRNLKQDVVIFRSKL